MNWTKDLRENLWKSIFWYMYLPPNNLISVWERQLSPGFYRETPAAIWVCWGQGTGHTIQKKTKQKNPETDKQGIGVIQRTISFSLGELVSKKLTCIALSRPSMRQVTAVIWYLWQSNYWKLLNGLMIIHSGFQVSPKVGMNAFCCLPQLTFPVKSSVLKPYDI